MRSEKLLIHAFGHIVDTSASRIDEQDAPRTACCQCPHVGVNVANDLIADIGAMRRTVVGIRSQHQLVEVLDFGLWNDRVIDSSVAVGLAKVRAIGFLGIYATTPPRA